MWPLQVHDEVINASPVAYLYCKWKGVRRKDRDGVFRIVPERDSPDAPQHVTFWSGFRVFRDGKLVDDHDDHQRPPLDQKQHTVRSFKPLLHSLLQYLIETSDPFFTMAFLGLRKWPTPVCSSTCSRM